MCFWKFSDGTSVRSRAKVEGNSPFAEHLRRELVCLGYGCGPLVWLPSEARLIEFDPASNLLLALWLQQEAKPFGIRLLETDFVFAPEAKAFAITRR